MPGLDPVPWMIGGGARHSATVGRALAYTAVGGGSGVTRSTDCRITAATTPAAKILAQPGGFSIEGTYQNQSGQAYTGRIDGTPQELAVPSTGASARSDLVVLRIDDPEFGGTVPSDPAVGPYAKLELISNVGSTATRVPAGVTYPAIPLARIDIPAGTQTITNAMIVDLRKMSQRWTERQLIIPGTRSGLLDTTSTAGKVWPCPARTIDIPARANTARIVTHVTGVRVNSGAQGKIFQKLNGQTSPVSTFDAVDVSSWQRIAMMTAHTFSIPASERGLPATLEIRAYNTGGSGDNRPFSDGSGTEIAIDIEFSEEPGAS